MYIKKECFIFFLVFALFLTLINVSQGIEINPTKEQVKETIKYGEAHPGKKIFKTELVAPAMFGDWPKFGGGLVKSKLIDLAVMSAMIRKSKQHISEEETHEIMESEYLAISYRGGADVYKIQLKQGSRLIEPIDMYKPEMGGKDPAEYAVFIKASFPYSSLDPNAKTTVIIIKDFGTDKYDVNFSNIK